MTDIQELENRIIQLEKRNIRVEQDKAWETSTTRKISVIIMTYGLIVLFMYIAGISYPWVNAIVPSIGFWLSTLTLPFVKKWWIKKNNE
ncbi:MAG: hypothetical protein GW939_00340 [Candidatus Magasanikbacteria bacterium]|nr:hypothetical protein [Candidatus Magasanikbacteria bacterium]NCS71686.1 hypothetical protein [Candidatus Magasanikbacteria bacterium]